jgi:hypothetical protein
MFQKYSRPHPGSDVLLLPYLPLHTLEVGEEDGMVFVVPVIAELRASYGIPARATMTGKPHHLSG